MKAYVLLITGHVQGVGFRWFTEREAKARDVCGYVRNLEDGNVEVLAQADPESLDAFCEQLREGPRAARVDDIRKTKTAVDAALSSFRVRF